MDPGVTSARGLALSLLVLVTAFAAIATPAGAHDSLAPPGAQHNWLPKEGWVWMHWLPFEEPELAAALGTNAAGLRHHLTDDRHTLAMLAKRRGWKPKPLARHLTRRFDGRVPAKRLANLRWRTERVLTQGHLAQHLLFHTFHGPAVPTSAPQLFGITREEFIAARQAALSPAAIAVRAGRDPAVTRAGVLALLSAEGARGVHTRSQSRAQARRMLARQRGALDCWMGSPLPKLDPANPFGGRDGDAGSAPAGSAPSRPIPGCQDEHGH